MSTLPSSRVLIVIALILLSPLKSLIAQSCGPECRAMNLSIMETMDGFISMVPWSDLIPNFICAAPIKYELTTTSGSIVARGNSSESPSGLLVEDPCRYLREGLMVVISNNHGTCMNRLTFKKGMLNFTGRYMELSCFDPRMDISLEDNAPSPVFACDGLITPHWVADWSEVKECQPGQDTAKIIYREWEAFDKEGYRYVSYDTLVVFRFPQLDSEHLYCSERDTLYCGVTEMFGPYIVYERIMGSGLCDTIFLVESRIVNGKVSFHPVQIDPSCGILLHLDTLKFTSGCEEIWKIELEIKQVCAGGLNSATCELPIDNQIEIVNQEGGYWKCSFWVHNLDTLAPSIFCDYSYFDDSSLLWPGSDALAQSNRHCFSTPSKPGDFIQSPVVLVKTNAHYCAALSPIPSICIQENWSGVKQVKASIDGIGSFILIQKDTCAAGDRYQYNGLVELPIKEIPYQISYVVSDGCHNTDTIYCYILVKDETSPIAIADKGMTVSLSGKTVWVDAATFDEGSFDNCQLNLVLARRSDWSSAGVNLCIQKDTICAYGDQILYAPILETDKRVNEIEAHYASTIQWLRQDDSPCGNLLFNAWQFGLIEASSRDCETGHLTGEQLTEFFVNKCNLDWLDQNQPYGCGPKGRKEQLIQAASQIGGGWSQGVPFTCEDACQTVTIEILVIDYWCNWSKSWTDVIVEDKRPVSIVQDLTTDLEITCRTYKNRNIAYPGFNHSISLEELVDLAKENDEVAIAAIAEVFGSYRKVWVNPQGDWVDSLGEVVADTLNFHDSICVCEKVRKQVLVYDDHLGMIWKDSTYTACSYKDQIKPIHQGALAVNCAQNVECRESIWTDLDQCGQGYIYRKFEIWSGCEGAVDSEHAADTLVRIQKIRVSNNCTLTKAMFDLPGDVQIFACGIEYDPAGSGNVVGDADPAITGIPLYRFDDDCRIIGIAHEDKVYKVVGGDEICYKIVRTWYFADWCGLDEDKKDGWWHTRDLIADSHIQILAVVDSVPPLCQINGPVESGGSISVASCLYDFSAELTVTGACGFIHYDYQIFRQNQAMPIAQSSGEFDPSISDGVAIDALDLEAGIYSLRVRVTDDCQNEGYCTYTFTIITSKKPTPICISSLTVELNPMDMDGDGSADTAMATIWAEEFNSSSIAPCGYGMEDLRFYLEVADAGNDGFDVLDTLEDLTYLELGCKHAGIQRVRMWVLSPTGTFDYCDVNLVVQVNSKGCPIILPVTSNIEGNILTYDDKGVKNVAVTSAVKDQVVGELLSDEDGLFTMVYGLGEVVTITPFKDGDDRNGINTADLLQLANHLSNSQPIVQGHRRIAADVNFDAVISVLDLLLMRNIILNNISAWPDGPSWRFLPEGTQFLTNKPEEEDLPEFISMELTNEHMRADFKAIKVGDLNLDRNTQLEGRSGEMVVMETTDRVFESGETVVFTPSFTSGISLQGLQFELHFDPNLLEFDGYLMEGTLRLTEYDLGLQKSKEGIIYCSWIHPGGWAFGKEEPLFSLRFTSKNPGILSEALSLVSRDLTAEAYPSLFEVRPIGLRFEVDRQSVMEVLNLPNPFSESTIIEASMEGDEPARLIISDPNGRIILERKILSTQGIYQTKVHAGDLGTPGVYFYSIIAANNSITRKMILLH